MSTPGDGLPVWGGPNKLVRCAVCRRLTPDSHLGRPRALAHMGCVIFTLAE